MCALSGTKFSLMKEAVSSSPYDSASSRAHAPQAGAALKSTSTGFFDDFASASAASASFRNCTFIIVFSRLREMDADKRGKNPRIIRVYPRYRTSTLPLERRPSRRAGKTPKSSTSHVFPSLKRTRAAGISVPSPRPSRFRKSSAYPTRYISDLVP
jgi:hypothetical protein